MASYAMGCPHCGTARVRMDVIGASVGENSAYLTALQCGHCLHGVFVEFLVPSGNAAKALVQKDAILRVQDGFHPIAIYPEGAAVETLEHVPENIAKFFAQAVSNLRRGDHDGAGMLARKVLEASCKRIDPDGAGTLHERIEALGKSGKLHVTLKDWAKVLKEGGNFAAHDEEPVKAEEAEGLVDFARIFLTYVFVMPGRIAEHTEEYQKKKQAAKTVKRKT